MPPQRSGFLDVGGPVPARHERELEGLVHSLTAKPRDGQMAWYLRPAALATIVLVATLLLIVVFF